MTPNAFELFSKYWAAPLSNALMVLLAIGLIYPIVWRIVDQLSEAIRAIETAKNLPQTIADLTDASKGLRNVNQEMTGLKDKLAILESINDGLEVANRRIDDLQRAADDRPLPPAADAAVPQAEVERWQRVSTLWVEAKDKAEFLIGNIRDGRYQRKYNTITRHVYTQIAGLMEQDKLLDHKQATALREMDTMFRSIRNRKTKVTPDLLKKFEAWHETILTANPPPDLHTGAKTPPQASEASKMAEPEPAACDNLH
jgi:hypothetical protein